MKQTILLSILSLWSIALFSQKAVFHQTAKTFSYGPRIGLNTSTLFFAKDELTEIQGIRVNFNGGIWSRYQLSDRWYVQANIDYSPRGSNLYKLNYLDIPITIAYNVRYKLFQMPMNFDFYAGLQPSFLTSAKLNTSEGTSLDKNIRSNFNKTGLDFVIGSGFPMWRFLFYATNKINLTSLSSSSKFDNNDPLGNKKIQGKLLRGWSTEWFIAYRFGSSNSFKPAE